MQKLLLFSFFLFFCFISFCIAGNFYVSPVHVGDNCTQTLPCSLSYSLSLLNDNDIILINPGTYTLDAYLIPANNITIRGLSSSFVPVLECNSSLSPSSPSSPFSSSLFAFSFSQSVVLENFIIQNCFQAFSFIASSVSSITISNVQFYNNGISLKLEGGPNLNINNSHFVNSYRNSIQYYGVQSTDSHVVIENSSFNSSVISRLYENPMCGAVRVLHGRVRVTRVTAVNHTCLYVNCSIDGSSDDCFNSSGAVFNLVNSSLSLVGSSFSHNVAFAGAAVATLYATFFEISSSFFRNNTADNVEDEHGLTFGGSIYLSYPRDVDLRPPVIPVFINSSHFSASYANNGGAIYVDDAYELNIYNSEFIGNIAGVQGAAIGQVIVNWLPPQSHIINCTFGRNLSGAGGAITMCAVVKDCIFDGNAMVAPSGVSSAAFKPLLNNGAAIFCSGFDLTIDNSVFMNHAAHTGIVFANVYSFSANNSQFRNNYAINEGTLRISGPPPQNRDDGVPDCVFAAINNCSFINNTATSSTVLVSDCLAVNMTNTLVANNTATLVVAEPDILTSPFVTLLMTAYTNFDFELAEQCKLLYNQLFCGNISFAQTTRRLTFNLSNSDCPGIKNFKYNETCRIYATEPLPPSSSSEDKDNSIIIAIVVPIAVVVFVVAILLAVFFVIIRKRSLGGSFAGKAEDLDELSECLIFDVEIGKEIGAGSFGKVFQGTWNGANVAIKTLVNQDFSELAREALLMKRLRHPNIVLFLGIYNDAKKNSKYMVTEFIWGGNLEYLLRNQPNLFSTNINRLRIASEIAAGMLLLEQAGIIHRDLAARNILIDTSRHEFTAKVSDFGMSRKIGSDYYTAGKDTLFPIKWAAPEVIKFGKYSSKADVWAMGILLWEIVTFGEVPYAGMSNKESSDWVAKGNRLKIPEDSPKEISYIIERCWNTDPNDRPTFVTIHNELQVALNPELKNKNKIEEIEEKEEKEIEKGPSRAYAYACSSVLDEPSSSSIIGSSVYSDSKKDDISNSGITSKAAPALSPYSLPTFSSSPSSSSSSSSPSLSSPINFETPLIPSEPSLFSLTTSSSQPSMQHLSKLTNLLHALPPSFNPPQKETIYDTFNDINEMKEVDDDGNEIVKIDTGERVGGKHYESNVL